MHTSFVPGAARRGPWSMLWADLRRSWRHAWGAARHEPVDDATLRDLGLSRCELASIEAEAAGQAERTRLRIAVMHAAGWR